MNYFNDFDKKAFMGVATAWLIPTKSKGISVEDMQEIVKVNKKLVKGSKDAKD